MQNKQDRQKLWNAQVGGAEEHTSCPGCLSRLIYLDRYKGWEAAHIRANSKGGSTELYNMFALCSVCNGQMKEQNMFCYFMNMENLHALRLLIRYVRKIVRLHYNLLWKACKGQMYHLARLIYISKVANDGGIPETHAVMRFFLQEDLKCVRKEALPLALELRKKRALAQELQDILDEREGKKKRIHLPVIMAYEMKKQI